MRRLGVVFLVAVGACSAGGSRYLSDSYNGSPVVLFQAEDNNWLLIDKPDKSKILVQRDLMRATTPQLKVALPRETYERTAIAYLTTTGRTCRVNRSSSVVEQIWEFTYDCGAQAVVASVLNTQ